MCSQDPAMILAKLVAETGLLVEHKTKVDLIPGLPAVPLLVVIPEVSYRIIFSKKFINVYACINCSILFYLKITIRKYQNEDIIYIYIITGWSGHYPTDVKG